MSTAKVGAVRIQRAAAQLTEELPGPPVDVVGLIRSLGFDFRSMALEPDVSGILYQEGDRTFLVVNSNHPDTRQRLAAAQQLGRLQLQQGGELHVSDRFEVELANPGVVVDPASDGAEAIAFAMNLLMPAPWVLRDFPEGRIDIDDEEALGEVAGRYGVSRQTLLLRLIGLRA